MSYWYLNKEGFPKVSLRERINQTNAHQYKREISELLTSQNDINEFYKLCKFIDNSGKLSNFTTNQLSNDLLYKTNDKFNIIIKGRQVGVSYALCVIALYNALFLNKSVALFSYNLESSINLLDKVKMIYSHLDDHLKYGVRRLNKGQISFNNGTTIRSFGGLTKYTTSYDLVVIDEYDFTSYKFKKELIANIYPVVSSRVGDKIIISSSLSSSESDYSISDLLTSEDYTIFNFNVLTIDYIDSIVKQYNRNKKINQILNGK